MIELLEDSLKFSFPEIHPDAIFYLDFQRTLRIPDDNRSYDLPPGLGKYPVHHVDDYAERLPEDWRSHGGVFFPMYQSEAMWIRFRGNYPFAVKIAAGKINAVTGDAWSDALSINKQDYVVITEQPWLDGFCVSNGLIRQFVAMPVGSGFTAEEQLTGSGEFGGIQIIAYPMKAAKFREYCKRNVYSSWSDMPLEQRDPIGLAPGGLMRQEVFTDQYGVGAWDTNSRSRCFVHILNSRQYHDATGNYPPTPPPTPKDYSNAGLPWFEYYSDTPAIGGASKLANLTSIAANWIKKWDKPMPGNEPIGVVKPIKLGKSNSQKVREEDF